MVRVIVIVKTSAIIANVTQGVVVGLSFQK